MNSPALIVSWHGFLLVALDLYPLNLRWLGCPHHRGIQLSKAMKNMDVSELRPSQVIDEEDDQVQVLS